MRILAPVSMMLHMVCTRAATTASAASADVTPSLESRMKGAFLGSLVADALALATHYEYDAAKIKKFYGKIDRYYAPGEKTGGQTHGVGWGQVRGPNQIPLQNSGHLCFLAWAEAWARGSPVGWGVGSSAVTNIAP